MSNLIDAILPISLPLKLFVGSIVWAKLAMQIEEEGLKSIRIKDMILGLIFLLEIILFTLIMKICQWVYMIYKKIEFLNYKPFDK